jgi:hypothetical protein
MLLMLLLLLLLMCVTLFFCFTFFVFTVGFDNRKGMCKPKQRAKAKRRQLANCNAPTADTTIYTSDAMGPFVF